MDCSSVFATLLIFTLSFHSYYGARDLSANNDCQCGVFKLDNKENLTMSFPWTIYVHVHVIDEEKTCVGTVIASNIILTSRSCITRKSGRLAEADELLITDNPEIYAFDAKPYVDTEVLTKWNCTKTVGIKMDYDFTSSGSKHKPVCVPTKDDHLDGPSLIGRKVWYKTSKGGLIGDLEVKEGKDCDVDGILQLGVRGLKEDVYCVTFNNDDLVDLDEGLPVFLNVRKNPFSTWGGPFGHYTYVVGLSTLVWEDQHGHTHLFFVPVNSVLNTVESIAATPETRWCPQPYPWMEEPQNIKRDKSLNCECGHRREGRQHRVAGGKEAIPREFPWLVKIFHYQYTDDGDFLAGSLCGGSIISDRIILTAGHCVLQHNRWNDTTLMYDVTDPLRDLIIHLNSHNYNDDPEEIIVKEAKVIFHPGFVDGQRRPIPLPEMDMALIILEKPLDFAKVRDDGEPLHRPICLPSFGNKIDLVGKPVTGWGKISPDLHNTSQGLVLQKLTTTMLSLEECQKHLKNNTKANKLVLNNGVVCGGLDWNKNINQGDSGGPDIMETIKGKYTQIGVNSYLNEIYGPDDTTVTGAAFFYADVQNENLLSWIDYYSNLYGAKYCRA